MHLKHILCLGRRLARLPQLTEATGDWYSEKGQPEGSPGSTKSLESSQRKGKDKRKGWVGQKEMNAMRGECRQATTISIVWWTAKHCLLNLPRLWH